MIFQNFFKPITETQKATAKEITEQLKPIREGIEGAPPQQAIMFPAYPSIKATSEPTERKDVQYIEDTAANASRKFIRRDEADRTFGLNDKDGYFFIGSKMVKIEGNDIEVYDNDGNVEEKYKGTPGLWELITAKEPKKKNIY